MPRPPKPRNPGNPLDHAPKRLTPRHWAYEPGDPAWDFSKALYAAAACDPDVLRAYTSVAALTAMPADVLAEPGMLDKVITVGSAAPRYSAPGPARAELLAALVP